MVRYLGISSHHRKMFQEIKYVQDIDVLHVRYNPAHRGAETEVFPYFEFDDRPGIVSFTATRWSNLLNQRKMPEDTIPLKASDCYRYVLSNSSVDVCMMGVRNRDQLLENLEQIEKGKLNYEEIQRVERIGQYVYDH